MRRYDSYVICTSPRSGSTLLCMLLSDTGVAGRPASYFHEPSISGWMSYHQISPRPGASEGETLESVFGAAIAKGRGGGDVFGMRLQRRSFDFFVEKLSVLHPDRKSDKDRFEAHFGRTLFIHLARKDKVEQAVSFVMAEQSGLWHKSPDGVEIERLAPHRAPIYDDVALKDCFETLTRYESGWKTWFETQEIVPFSIDYEALSADPVEVLRAVLDRLGLDRSAADHVRPRVAKLADGVSRDWVARLRRKLEGA